MCYEHLQYYQLGVIKLKLNSISALEQPVPFLCMRAFTHTQRMASDTKIDGGGGIGMQGPGGRRHGRPRIGVLIEDIVDGEAMRLQCRFRHL